MTLDQLNKKSARAMISDAMKIFRGPESYVKQHKERVFSDGYDKLSRHQIDQGVIALVLECNLSGGSVSGGVDLYKLVRTYLWDPQARSEMNAVVRRYGL